MLKPDLIKDIQDMRHLSWTRTRKSSGTAGSYLKSYGELDGSKLYYKLSYYDSMNGIAGHECVNELIVSRLLGVLGIEHVAYQLIHAKVTVDSNEYETWLCASEDYKEKGEAKIAFDDFYELEKFGGESIMAFCQRMGWEDYIYKMLVVDFLILNRDRHGANIEILQTSGITSARPAPLFDHGISLVYNCRSEDEVKIVDPMEEKPVQCFVGSRSARENLNLIPHGKKPVLRNLEMRDRAVIFDGLEEVLPKCYLEKIWEMLMARWNYYESL